MKIVTYNVNGLRPRIAQFGSLLKLLNSLDADIICVQETKLSREEVTADLIMAEGYESFFSCTYTLGRGRLGYSGVATFCRVSSAFSSTEVALPVAAEEGFTGLLQHFRKSNSIKKKFLLDISTKVDASEGFSHEDLLNVDSEGRCIITDHGHFVLFNIYGPRAVCDDTERIDFKLNFFKLLQKRWESFLRQGKRVLVVGDLNIAPSVIDRCEAGLDFENNQFRKWFRSLLVGHGGHFFDVFRQKHPERKDAYTCWSVASGAEEFNFGSRIDHILVAGRCLHCNENLDGHSFMDCHISDCDIMLQFKRWKPDNIPRWKGGKNVKLEGSDHAPVYVCLRELPDLPEHNTPSLAARYVPKVHGFQQTIGTFLLKRQVRTQVKDHGDPLLYDENSQKNCDDNNESTSQDGCVSVSPLVPNSFTGNQETQDVSPITVVNEASKEKIMSGSTSDIKKPIPVECKKNNKKARHDKSIQQTLGSYFQKSVDSDTAANLLSQKQLSKTEQGFPLFVKEPGSCEGHNGNTHAKDSLQLISTSQSSQCSPEKEKHNVALLEWQRIQELMLKRKSVPLCKGHKEPCVARVVKKEGPNLGRKFYVCHRAEGPSSNPDARCDYFKWQTESGRQRR